MCLSLCSRLCHWGPLVALGKKKLRKYHTYYLLKHRCISRYDKKHFIHNQVVFHLNPCIGL